MDKQCVICDKTYHPKVDRYDNVTCSVACRSKLHRERRKAKAEQDARSNASSDQRLMMWLQERIPDASHNLDKIKAIYGKDAFQMACEAVQAVGRYKANK